MTEMTGPNKVKNLLSKPDINGELMTKVVNTQSQVAALVDKVEDIEEEFSNQLEKLEIESKETILKLDKKIEVLESLIRKLLNEQKSTVTRGETPSYQLGSTSKTDNDDDSIGKTENPIKMWFMQENCQKF